MGPPAGGDIVGIIVVLAGAVATFLVFVLAFRATLWPSETAPDHPKHLIFKDNR